MDVWVDLLDGMLGLKVFGAEYLYQYVCGARYALTGQSRPGQTGHSDFEVREGKSHGFFVLIYVSEERSLFVFLAWHTYVNYPMSKKKKISKLLQMDDVETFQFSVFDGHEYWQHVNCGLRGHCWQRCHTHLILASYGLKDVVAVA